MYIFIYLASLFIYVFIYLFVCLCIDIYIYIYIYIALALLGQSIQVGRSPLVAKLIKKGETDGLPVKVGGPPHYNLT